MANNIEAYVPKILAMGILALRKATVLPRLVNADYSQAAAEKGSTITISIPSAIAVQDVTPAATPPSTADIVPTSATIVLDKWKEAPFHLSDKELLEAENDIVPGAVSAAVAALIEQVNADILANYKKFYGASGTAGTTPFASDATAATAARRILNVQLAPIANRRIVLDPLAEEKALGLAAFADAVRSGDPAVIMEGQIGRKLGFDWYMDQQVPIHTAGTGTGYLVNNAAGYAAGSKTIAVDTGSGTLIVGDIITFAGHTQQYVVTTALSGGSVSFEPGLAVAVADNVAITKVATHTANLAFHRDAIGFAARPLISAAGASLGAITQSAIDPVTGLPLRLEVTREHKRVRWSFDMLYGTDVVRRELGARILG